MFEYRSPEGALVACALSDELSDGLSMVFSFYEPDIGGLGTFMILDHIRRTGDLGLDYGRGRGLPGLLDRRCA